MGSLLTSFSSVTLINSYPYKMCDDNRAYTKMIIINNQTVLYFESTFCLDGWTLISITWFDNNNNDNYNNKDFIFSR